MRAFIVGINNKTFTKEISNSLSFILVFNTDVPHKNTFALSLRLDNREKKEFK